MRTSGIIDRHVRATIIGWAALVACTGCGCGGPHATATHATRQSIGTPTSNPNGWGVSLPTAGQIQEMSNWALRNFNVVDTTVSDTASATAVLTGGAPASSGRAIQDSCRTVTQALSRNLPAALPTPDIDLTSALKTLIIDGSDLATDCSSLADPPSAPELHAASTAMLKLAEMLQIVVKILDRDVTIIQAAGK